VPPSSSNKKNPAEDFFQRLTRLFRSGPSIQRRIKGQDSKSYYSNKLIQGNYGYKATAPFGFGRENSPFSVLGSYGILDRMARYSEFSEMDYCLHEDTLIAVPGGYRKIKDLADEYGLTKEFIVYSYDHDRKTIVPAIARQARQTRTDHAYKVKFDSGKEIIGTSNHLLMKRDGTYCEIGDLKLGDSMMPFYRRSVSKDRKEGQENCYQTIYTMNKSVNSYGWTSEHKLLASFVLGRELEKNEVVHHKNFKADDNRLDNLQVMTVDEHKKYHAEILNGRKWDYSKNSEWIEKFKKQHSEWMKKNNPSERKDITFARILQWCKENSFNVYKLSRSFDTDINTIKNRLRTKGFKDFVSFAKAYDSNWKSDSWDNQGTKNPRYSHDVDFLSICNEYTKGKTITSLSAELGISKQAILNRVRNEGYENWKHFQRTHNNHKVVSVEYYGLIPLYDLTVDKYKNFATDSVISHNTPELAAGLDVYSDEVVGGDDRGKCFHVLSENEKIKEALDDLFYDVMNVEFNLRTWTRNLLKYGDFFLYVEVAPDMGIINVTPIPVNEIEREEGYDVEDPYSWRFKWLTRGNKYLENWQVAHLRILNNDLFMPYGSCLVSDTKVLTSKGIKEIKDLQPNKDEIVSYDIKTGAKTTSMLLDKVCSGKKQCFRINTKHSSFDASKEHKILTFDRKTKTHSYKHVSELVLGDLLLLSKNHKAFNEKDLQIKIEKDVPPGITNKLVLKAWSNISCVNDYVDEDFARLFGFMLGDGWLQKSWRDKKLNSVAFSAGINEEQNMFYTKLLEKYSGKIAKTYKVGSKNGKSKTIQVHSTMLATIFERMGFISGAHEKRIPYWVYSCSDEVKTSFIEGFVDADGTKNVDKWSCARYQIQICNESLLKDLKALIQSVGWKTGKITKRVRTTKRIFETTLKNEMHSSYVMYFWKSNDVPKNSSINNNSVYSEPILSINPIGDSETWDIYVQNRNHNFFANNVAVHNSILEPARRIHRQLLMLEDAMLVYRIIRSPERRVFYIDVGNIDPNDVPNYMEAAKATLRSQSNIEREHGREDQRLNAMPVAWNTSIPLLDGRNITIKQLAEEFDSGKTNWVHSISDKTSELLPGKVVWCGKNYTANKMVHVTLDDGSVVKTAPEHPFILRDNTSKRADELAPGDSMMPFYRKISSKKYKDKISGYSKVYDPKSGKYKFIHRVVGNTILKEQREQARKSANWNINKNLVVHHKNINKLDNNPVNLQWMGDSDHSYYHSTINKAGFNALMEYVKTEENRNRVSRNNRKLGLGKKLAALYNGTELHKEHNALRQVAQLQSWNTKRKERCEAMRWKLSNKGLVFIENAIKNNPGYGKRRLVDKLKSNKQFMNMLQRDNEHLKRDPNKFSTYALISLLQNNFGFKNGLNDFRRHVLGESMGTKLKSKHFQHENHLKNHKVVDVKIVDESCDVFCMTVVGPNGENDRHNFAISSTENSGVIVKNSILDDYFIPVRGNQQGTKIETISGATHATATEDVEYIQRKLFAAIKVPKPYLNFDENLSSKATLSQMDVRFSRSVQMIQKIVISELNRLAMIHLYSKGFDGSDLINFQLKLSNPSSVALQQKLELWSVKFDTAGAAKDTGLVDINWVQKNILELGDGEIKDIKKGLVQDSLRQKEIEEIEFEPYDSKQPPKTTDVFDTTNYAVPGSTVGREPASSNGSGLQQKQPEKDFVLGLRSYDEDGNEVVKDLEDSERVSTPIKATPFLTRHKRNRTRRVGISTGRSNIAMPDLASMLSPRNKYNKDITGLRAESVMNEYKNGGKKVVALSEEELVRKNGSAKDDVAEYTIELEPKLNRTMRSMFFKLENSLKINKKSSHQERLLTEAKTHNDEDEIEIDLDTPSKLANESVSTSMPILDASRSSFNEYTDDDADDVDLPLIFSSSSYENKIDEIETIEETNLKDIVSDDIEEDK
jgi:hypothetical protein